MNHKTISFLLTLAVILLAAGCRAGGADTPTETPPPPEAVFTSAAQTAEARMTENAAITPTEAPPTATGTVPPATDTSLPPTATNTTGPTINPDAIDLIEFISDVTVPDGTDYAPGTRFTKTWRLRNIGNTTWTTAYALVFVDGTQMGGTSPKPLTQEVPAGQSVDVSVDLTAPAAEGTYYGYWMLRNAAGQNFGLGPDADLSFYVQIDVKSDAAAPTATSDGTAAPTATQSAEAVSGVSLSVDEAQVATTCPHTFSFEAEFTLNQAGSVTYELEADTGFAITLPAPTTTDLDAGQHRVNYTLEFTDSVSGWARFRVSQPLNKVSSQVEFELTCE